MTTTLDPEGQEAATLASISELNGARVLEVGIGDGRMTWEYASRAGAVVGLDPDYNALLDLHKDRPVDMRRLTILCGSSLALPFAAHTFDAALLSWTL